MYRVCRCLSYFLVVEFLVEYFQSQEIVRYHIRVVCVKMRTEFVLHQRQDVTLFITDKSWVMFYLFFIYRCRPA